MTRFNKPNAVETEKAPSVRVCLFVDPDIYRRLKAQCVLDGTNVSRWFNENAAATVEKAEKRK